MKIHYTKSHVIMSCSHQHRIFCQLLIKEYEIVEKCNNNISQFSKMLNELQCINHNQDSDERTLKCDEFIYSGTRIS